MTSIYYSIKAAKNEGEEISPGFRVKLYLDAKDQALLDWKACLLELRDNQPGFRIRNALVSRLREWSNRKHGWITYHMTQFLTGHGCFNKFLYRINKVESALCAHCLVEVDTAQHTFQFCSAWYSERCGLVRVIRDELDLPSVILAILDSIINWKAFSTFCTKVLSRKKAAERERQAVDRSQVVGYLDSETSD
ncbi:uncharacterized protein [Linepithema humile]|uniref:uncharacterized protein n=1 Tax=Linepithema humile TaxID=83485 RepID=UPI0006231E39|nr:PREDICTED: uncharacterized protein LOC105680168 [Linepithema humile]